MPAPLFPRVPKRLVVGLTAAALVVAAGCSKDSTTTAGPTSTAAGGAAPTTTAAPAASTSTAAPSTTAAPTTTTTAARKKEVGNSDIKAALSASDPELWALVNYDIMSWDAFGGFNVPLKAGADETKALALCEAVAKVVYAGSGEKTPIVIAVGATVDDISGTPVVERKNKAGACAAV